MTSRFRPLALAFAACAAAACGRTPVTFPPVTTVEPAGGPFAGHVVVKLTTDVPAVVRWTLDGSDPRKGGAAVQQAPAPVELRFDETQLLTYSSAEMHYGRPEEPRGLLFERVGPEPGTIAGKVMVDGPAVGKRVALIVNTPQGRKQRELAASARRGELEFLLEGLGSGDYALRAVADVDGDGNFFPFLDLASDPASVTLDVTDLRRAGAENVVLYLGKSKPGLATLRGTITVPRPEDGRPLSLLLLDPGALTGGMDPAQFLQQLGAPAFFAVTTQAQTRYPYSVTDLEPAQYLPVPVLGSLGLGGAHLNLLVEPLKTVDLGPDDVATVDFAYGPATLSGAVHLTGVTDATGLPYGALALRPQRVSLSFQVAFALVFFQPDANGDLVADYRAEALAERDWAVKVFARRHASDPEPLGAALAWALNPFGGAGDVVVPVRGDATQDLTVP
jgi:hypothetical protein